MNDDQIITSSICDTNTKNKFSTNNPTSSFLLNKTLSIRHSNQCNQSNDQWYTGFGVYDGNILCICRFSLEENLHRQYICIHMYTYNYDHIKTIANHIKPMNK